jgi:hypothetical protein
VCENGVLRRILRPEGVQVAGGLRKLYIEKLHNMYFSTTFILWFLYVGISEYVCSTEGRLTGEG